MGPSSELSSGSYAPGDTLDYFFERSVPDLFARLSLHFSFHYVNQNGSRRVICFDILESVLEIVRQGRSTTFTASLLELWCVNASGHICVEGTGENAVTKTRVNEFSDVERHRTLRP
jgi:hypothetical protein